MRILPELPIPCSRRQQPRKPIRAFTLIELLVVVALMALLISGFGRSLSDATGTRLAAAQHTIHGICGTARAQAALRQTETRIVLYAEPPPAGDREKFLRLLQVYRADPAGSQTWIASSAPTYLPRGTYVLPPSLAGLVAADVEWPVNARLHSTLREDDAPRGESAAAFAGATRAFVVEFQPDGSPAMEGASYLRVLVGTARDDGDGPRFNQANAIRGVILRPTGATGLINDPSEL